MWSMNDSDVYFSSIQTERGVHSHGLKIQGERSQEGEL